MKEAKLFQRRKHYLIAPFITPNIDKHRRKQMWIFSSIHSKQHTKKKKKKSKIITSTKASTADRQDENKLKSDEEKIKEKKNNTK